jgi:hypothetical protein
MTVTVNIGDGCVPDILDAIMKHGFAVAVEHPGGETELDILLCRYLVATRVCEAFDPIFQLILVEKICVTGKKLRYGIPCRYICHVTPP